MLPEFDLTGRVALVTGGNRGIGRGIALGLARAGADIVIAARNREQTALVESEVADLGRRAVGVECDITEREGRVRAVSAALDTFGTLSILVNNAGIARGGPPETYPEADWDAVVDTNLKSVFLLCQQAYPALLAAHGGKIINIGSTYSLVGGAMVIAYSASKGGVVQLTRSLAGAWAKDNIQVNCIIPGWIRTEMIIRSMTNPARVTGILSRTPAVRFGEPEDIAGLAILLASHASNFITGQSIAVDGGLLTADPTTDFRGYRPAPAENRGASEP